MTVITFQKGKAVDLAKVVKAFDDAGFKAGEMTLTAKGKLAGPTTFEVSGTGQKFTLTENEPLKKLREVAKDKEVTITAKVDLNTLALAVESF